MKPGNTETIPVVDLGPYLAGQPGAMARTADQLRFALTEIGFYFIVNHGVPAERSNPADSSNITRQPAHGKAEFVAPHAKYTPDRGYVGEDEFEYEAFARGRSNQQVRLKVQVKVLIVAP